MVATATRKKPAKKVAKRKASKRRAPAQKRPDPDQLRFVDPETGEIVNGCYRCDPVDRAFNQLRKTEYKIAEVEEARADQYENLKSDRFRWIEKKMKALKEEAKELHDQMMKNRKLRGLITESESLKEKRDDQREDLEETLSASEEAIKKGNDGNPYVCIDPRNKTFYVGLSEEKRTLTIRKTKLALYGGEKE